SGTGFVLASSTTTILAPGVRRRISLYVFWKASGRFLVVIPTPIVGDDSSPPTGTYLTPLMTTSGTLSSSNPTVNAPEGRDLPGPREQHAQLSASSAGASGRGTR